MLASTGFLVQAAGFHFPGMISDDLSFASLAAMKPVEQWLNVPEIGKYTDKIFALLLVGVVALRCRRRAPLTSYVRGDFAGKWHIFSTIFIAEMLTEIRGPHYMRGGELPKIVFPPRLADDITEGWREDKLKDKQAKELNNGRLAMVGMASFLSEYFNPGSVPILSALDAF